MKSNFTQENAIVLEMFKQDWFYLLATLEDTLTLSSN